MNHVFTQNYEKKSCNLDNKREIIGLGHFQILLMTFRTLSNYGDEVLRLVRTLSNFDNEL